jgi:AAA15 family ATPase/GTPase
MFQSEKTNPNRAQLIFTSHDNTLQRGNLLRRDQIWFTQKREDGSTELYSLSDFRPRNDLAIDKAYLDGRFGAVPVLPDEEELLQPAGQ